MRTLTRSLVPWLVPLAPFALAATVLTWHEVRPASPANLDSRPTRPISRPVLSRRPVIIGRRFSVRSGSQIRVCVGTAPDEVWVCAPAITGTLCLGADGMAEQIEVTVDLQALRREDAESVRQLIWDVLGAQRYGSLTFRGTRHVATRTAVPGVSKVSFRGSIQVGNLIRHVTIPLWISTMPDNRLRVLGRGRTSGSKYGLPGRRSKMPFCEDEPLVVVWDLVF